MTRRVLCFRLVAILATLLAICSPVRVQTLTGTATVTAITYECNVDASLLSPGAAFYDLHANELFVAASGNGRIVVYAPDLTPKFSFQHFVPDRTGQRLVQGEPKYVVTTSRGDMLVIDNLADYVDVLDFRGRSVDRIYPNRLLGDTSLKAKADLIAIDSQDHVYLSISGDLPVVIALDQDYGLKRRVIVKGDGPGGLGLPIAMTVSDSLLVLADLQGTPVVRIYDTLGHYLSGFGGREIEQTDFSLPVSIAIMPDSAGNIYFLVEDALRQVVKLLDDKGKHVANIGGYGVQLGAFQYPVGLTYAGKGTIFVVERVGNRIQKFTIQ